MKMPGIDEVAKIAEAAFADERTVVKAYSGQKVRPLALQRIIKAATELGIPPPKERAA